jgi:hypothetical protein
MKRIALIFLGVVVFTFALVLVLNQIDESLKPEVARILDKKPNLNETEAEAYQFLKEHYSEFKDVTEPKCRERACSSKSLKEKPELRELLTQNDQAIKDYARLMEFGDIASGFSPTPENPLEDVMLVPYKMHSLFLLQLAAWREKGGGMRVVDLIESSNHYLKHVMESGTLLERMIAVTLMKRNSEFLAQELEVQPTFRKQFTPELIQSFSTPSVHDILSGAMEDELRLLAAFVRSNSRDRFDLDLSVADWWEAFTLKNERAWNLNLFLRPNQTINDYYTVASESLATDCTIVEEENESKCLPSWAKLRPKWPWQKAINPTGRYFVRIVGAGYVHRKQKLQKSIAEIYEFRKAITL